MAGANTKFNSVGDTTFIKLLLIDEVLQVVQEGTMNVYCNYHQKKMHCWLMSREISIILLNAWHHHM